MSGRRLWHDAGMIRHRRAVMIALNTTALACALVGVAHVFGLIDVPAGGFMTSVALLIISVSLVFSDICDRRWRARADERER